MKILIIASLAVLAGCTTTFTHPSKGETEFNQDLYHCQKVAEQRTANTGFAGNPLIQNDYTRECLIMEKGWKPE